MLINRVAEAGGGTGCSSRHDPVVQVNHPVAETPLVQQLEPHADTPGQRSLAAPHHDGRDDQVALVDQPGLDRLAGQACRW
jgi:hypothetical protein